MKREGRQGASHINEGKRHQLENVPEVAGDSTCPRAGLEEGRAKCLRGRSKQTGRTGCESCGLCALFTVCFRSLHTAALRTAAMEEGWEGRCLICPHYSWRAEQDYGIKHVHHHESLVRGPPVSGIRVVRAAIIATAMRRFRAMDESPSRARATSSADARVKSRTRTTRCSGASWKDGRRCAPFARSAAARVVAAGGGCGT